METQSLWWSLSRHKLVALLTFLLVAAIAVAAAYTPKNRYSSSTTLSAMPVTSTSSGSFNPAFYSYLIPSLQAQATSKQLKATVRQKLAAQVGNASWTVTTSLEPGTGVLHLSATSRDQDIVAPVANATADALRADQPATGPLAVAVIDPATRPSSPSSPARMVILLSGLGIGVILALFAAMVAGARGRRRSEVRARDNRTESTPPTDGRHPTEPLPLDPARSHATGQGEPVTVVSRASSSR